jgi:amidohydrolase
MIEKIKNLATQYFNEIKSIREHIHAYPELSFQEFETSKFVQQKLTEYKIPFETGIAKTGIVALLKSTTNADKKVIALRSELDALPINEKNNCSYHSRNVGVMHACGHDVHTACLLGAAKILNELKDEWQGTVKLIFQPSEEKEPGGASVMINEGVLENPKPEKILALHVHPSMQVGKTGFKGGLYMASADEIYLTVKGKGGHGALPQNCVDPVLIASHIIVALQQIVSRNAYPIIPTVLSFGKMIANGATNVIPDEVRIEGTLRTMDEVWRKQVHQKINQIAKGIAQSMGGDCDVEISNGYPCLTNDTTVTNHSINFATEYLGKNNVEELDLRMTAEDFSFFANEIPACFFRLGTASENGNNSSAVHTATFDIDAKALEIGAGLMAYQAMQHLQI